MTALVVAGAFLGSLAVTLGAGVVLEPDVAYYTSGIGFFPSPVGTLIGTGLGVAGLGLLHASAVAVIVWLVITAAPPAWAVFASLPALFWLVPLGVDAVSAALLAGALLGLGTGALVVAGLTHAAAIPVGLVVTAVQRGMGLPVAGFIGAVLLVLALTPYGAAVPTSGGALLLGAGCALIAVALGFAPAVAGHLELSPALSAVALGVGGVAWFAAASDLERDLDASLVAFAVTRYALPLAVCVLVVGARVSDGRTERPKTAPTGGWNVKLKTFSLMVAAVALVALALVPSAFAQTVPAIPVDDYGDALLSSLATAIGTIFPYAAAITAFAIGVSMVKRWLGHRKATRV